MVAIGYILLVLGCIVGLIGEIMFLTVAYKRNLWWFFGCLFIPLVSLVFFIFNLRATANSFCLQIFGLLIIGLGAWMAGIGMN